MVKHISWKRLPATWDEIFLRALGKPDPQAGWGIPCPWGKGHE